MENNTGDEDFHKSVAMHSLRQMYFSS